LSLVDNATFSDGKPFSADDVVFTFNAMRNDSNFVYYDSLKWLLGNLSSSPNAVQKIHDTAIKLTTRFCESNELLLALQIPIYPAHLLQSYSVTAKTWSELSNDLFSVGTGPFILKNTNSSQKISFQRRVDLFQSYHRPTLINSSVIDTFNIIRVPTYDTAIEKFSIGEVHALSDRYEAGRRLSEFKKDSYTKHNAVGRKILALFPNHNHPILYNKNIRKMFAQLLNSTSFTMASYSSYASPANSFIAPSSIFHNTSLQLTQYSSTDASISFTLGIQELIGDGILKDWDGDGLPDPISIINTSTQTAEEAFIFIPFLETLVSLVCVSCFYFYIRKLKSR
jgi:peptide/nickel transport system substrate-binding protein